MKNQLLGYLLLAGMAWMAFDLVRALATGKVRFLIGASWVLEATRAASPARYWGFLVANAAVLALVVYALGPWALELAGF